MSIEKAFEKPTISFVEYMDLQRIEIQRAICDIEFIQKVQQNFGLDKNQLPEKNDMVSFWIKENSDDFRKRMEEQYTILNQY